LSIDNSIVDGADHFEQDESDDDEENRHMRHYREKWNEEEKFAFFIKYP
jgi:hypothetical protein